ncbi:hypothetical protein SAMN04488093_101543 [Tropicibacter naphthalenivorans]|uniref:Uncharacterized protein n=2 Tax=Tropicibacter naphthalenivorans TaxID=441103 RepID=A0A0P1G0V5_9RHOB|nr:hypothetical protein TRN7648_00337 [Tropicibacter naphthalenivorans]SMC45422.1 hypothetical protein SAMN04488093_101543 [Tropicibacter naphthalenivorans]
MRTSFGFAQVHKVAGMVREEMDGWDGQNPTSKKVALADYYVVKFPIYVKHDAMDQTDEPLNCTMAVRIPIFSDDEPFNEIVSRAKEQLRQDALEIASSVEVDK